MTELSHVAMFNCFICGEPAGVVLDRRLRKSLPRNVGAIDREPCQKCKEHMKQGVIFISVRDGEEGTNPYRTGGWVVVRDEAVKRILGAGELLDDILRRRVAFIPDEAWNMIGLPRAENTGKGI